MRRCAQVLEDVYVSSGVFLTPCRLKGGKSTDRAEPTFYATLQDEPVWSPGQSCLFWVSSSSELHISSG